MFLRKALEICHYLEYLIRLQEEQQIKKQIKKYIKSLIETGVEATSTISIALDLLKCFLLQYQ